MFRKEEVGDLLALRFDDTPKTTGNDKTASTEDAFMAQVDVRYPRGTMQVRDCRPDQGLQHRSEAFVG
jgi:hypothetical protein